MSAIIYGRVFWTPFKELSYQDKNKKVVKIKETTAKIVMLAIADSADDFGENSWQSFETIATKASIERRSVIRVVRALIGNNYLSIAGKTQYGTNNFTINRDILGHAPAKRAKTGRPKSGDSEALPFESGDSDTESGDPESVNSDSEAKSGDDQSPNPSLNPPSPVHESEGARNPLFSFYENKIGMLTPIMADAIEKAEKVYTSKWVADAIELAAKNNARHWNYCEKVLERWQREGRQEKKQSAAQSGDSSKYLQGEYAGYIR